MFINRGLVKCIRLYPNIEMAYKCDFTMEILMYLCGKLSNNNKHAVKVWCLWVKYRPIYVYKNRAV